MKAFRVFLFLLCGLWGCTVDAEGLEAGKYYQILNVKTECALSNLGDGSNNARLFFDETDMESPE